MEYWLDALWLQADDARDDVPLTPGAEQVVSALRLAVNTTRSSYEAGVRVIEEAEREAVARFESAGESGPAEGGAKAEGGTKRGRRPNEGEAVRAAA